MVPKRSGSSQNGSEEDDVCACCTSQKSTGSDIFCPRIGNSDEYKVPRNTRGCCLDAGNNTVLVAWVWRKDFFN